MRIELQARDLRVGDRIIEGFSTAGTNISRMRVEGLAFKERGIIHLRTLMNTFVLTSDEALLVEREV